MIFSVIVPFLNEERYIERCIKSLLDQDFDKKEYEVIFIDNGSTDRSYEIARRFPGIILLREERRGTYVARNKGLEAARGGIIALTDADCVVSRNWLSVIYEGMRKTGAMIVLGKRLFPSDSRIFLKIFEDYENAESEYILGKLPASHFYGTGNNMAIRAEAFKRLGRFIEFPELGDTEFVKRYVAATAHPEVAYLPEMEVTHLEITNVRTWLAKRKYYSELESLARGIADHAHEAIRRPSLAAAYMLKWRLYIYCVRKNGYGFIKAAILFILLAIGFLYSRAGEMQGELERKTKYALFYNSSVPQ